MTKYIFVTGGVVSGLGKGITAASLGRLLKARGYKVAAQKLDPYINVDPGTMSPYQHGEVFVTEDGAETDLDLGHYERFIDENLNGLAEWTQKHNNYANREIVAAYEGFWNDSVSGGNGLESRNKEKGKYYKLPKFLRAFVYFFVRYICFGGFLDGKPGFIWATLQAYWYRFLVDAKIEEMEFYIGKNPSPQEMRSYFKERFNINVDK